MKPLPPGQFAAFRLIFGGYLAIHFATQLPHATELFSNAGVLGDAHLNPLFGLFPNPLTTSWGGSPTFVSAFIAGLVGLSVLFVSAVILVPLTALPLYLSGLGWAGRSRPRHGRAAACLPAARHLPGAADDVLTGSRSRELAGPGPAFPAIAQQPSTRTSRREEVSADARPRVARAAHLAARTPRWPRC